jgi:cytochrome c oxidase subunit 2
MHLSRRAFGTLLLGGGVWVLSAPAEAPLFAQDPPSRREFTISARDFRFSPDRIEVLRDEVVKLTVKSEDIAYSFTIDEYRLSRRVPAGASTTFEFRADRAGTFPFYSNLSSESGHAQMKGALVVRVR